MNEIRKPKGIMEQRAADFCARIKDFRVPVNICLEWKETKTYGRCPHIYDFSNNPIAKSLGCGYDLKSACMVDLFMWMAETPEQFKTICGLNATGMSNFEHEFNKLGLGQITTTTCSGGWVDVFTYAPPLEPKPTDISDLDCVLQGGCSAYVDVPVGDKIVCLAIKSTSHEIDVYSVNPNVRPEDKTEDDEVLLHTFSYGDLLS